MRLFAAAALAFLLTGCVDVLDFQQSDRYQSDFRYSFDLDAAGAVDAEIFNGAIEIEGWDGAKVEISGVKYGATPELRDAVRLEVHNSPALVEFRAVRPDITGGSGVRLTLRVPRKANGSGAYRLRTSNGRIEARRINGSLEAHTSNGAVSLEDIAGKIVVQSSNGRIQAEGVRNAFDASTTNGRITVTADKAPPAPVRLITTNGSIDLSMHEPPADDIQATTTNGSVNLRLPGDTGARVAVSTSHGHIHSDFGIEGDTHAEGTIGKGGPRIKVTTSNGSVDISRIQN